MSKTDKIEKNYQNYLFDADGTLMDTTELIFRSCQKTAKRFAGRDVPREDVISLIGVPLEANLIALVGERPDEEFRYIIKEHVDYQFEIADRYLKIFPGVIETLERLKEQGKRLAVVSSRKSPSLISYFKTLGIYSFFELYITPESTEKHKPDAEPALEAMKRLGAVPQQTLFIGDSRWDIECAAGAGIDSCFVGWSDSDINTLPVKPTYHIETMKSLL